MSDEFNSRQFMKLRDLVRSFRDGTISLNAFIQQVEAVNDVLKVGEWQVAIFPIVLSMEQLNAIALEAGRSLTETERSLIEDSLRDLDLLISRFESA